MITADIIDVLAPGQTIDVASPEAMRGLAARISDVAEEGDVVALYGELGAGKTEFVKGFVDGKGGDLEQVTSPTFTLIHEYSSARLPIYHFDAYRVQHARELVDMGLDEYLFGDGICVIEWPEIIEHLLPDEALRLRLEHGAGRSRSVTRLA